MELSRIFNLRLTEGQLLELKRLAVQQDRPAGNLARHLIIEGMHRAVNAPAEQPEPHQEGTP